MAKARPASHAQMGSNAFWRTADVGAAASGGLSAAEAVSRLAADGPNTLEETGSTGLPAASCGVSQSRWC